jgi:MoaA/NifB/PqqE/SkfB family radical SAM enzyme
LLNKDFWVIARRASKAGILVSVAINGTLITRRVARRLKSVGVRYVEVSLDSPVPEVHDRFRGVKGAWDMAIKGVMNAKAEGLSVGIAFTVTKLNQGDVEELLRLAKELGVDAVVAFNFIPTGRGKSIVSLDLNPYERYEFLKRLHRAWRDLGLQAYSTAFLKLFQVLYWFIEVDVRKLQTPPYTSIQKYKLQSKHYIETPR